MSLKNLSVKVPSLVEYGIFAAFLLFYFYFKFTFHELWKDEWQAWLMARDMGWFELIGSLYYEGHPGLWYIYLKIWTLFSTGTNDPVLLQAAHAAVMTGAYYLLFFRFKIPFWIKVLLLLSYYPFFEYGIVSRGYALVMLLGYWIVLLLNKPEKHLKKLMLLIFLFCQTEAYAVMMAGALVFYLFLEKGGFKSKKKLWQNETFKKIALSSLAGLAIFILSVFPRSGQEELSRAYLSEPFSGEILFKGFQGMFANTFWIGSIPDTNVFGVSGLGAFLSAIVLAGLISFFRKEKNILWTLLFFIAGYFTFLVSIYTGGVRQWGMFFIFFTMLLHLFYVKKGSEKIDIGQIVFLVSIFIFQIRYTAMAVQKEYKFPFTNAQIAADFIREKVPDQVPLVAINKFEVAPVTGYVNRNFYALPSGEPFTYFKWVEKIYLPPEQELKMFADFKNVGGIVIISPKPLDSNRYPNAQLWKSFDQYSIKRENYYLYSLKK